MWAPYLAQSGLFDDPVNAAAFALNLIQIFCGFAMVYLFWLGWRYADDVQRVASGTTDTFRGWSGLHYRIAWFAAWTMGVNFASRLAEFVISKMSK